MNRSCQLYTRDHTDTSSCTCIYVFRTHRCYICLGDWLFSFESAGNVYVIVWFGLLLVLCCHPISRTSGTGPDCTCQFWLCIFHYCSLFWLCRYRCVILCSQSKHKNKRLRACPCLLIRFHVTHHASALGHSVLRSANPSVVMPDPTFVRICRIGCDFRRGHLW